MVPHYHSHRWMFLGICVGLLFVSANAKAAHKVYCTESSMKVEISISPETAPQIYLEGMKGYPNEKCQPTIEGSLAVINLSLDDIHECGVTRVVNKVTGKKTYYHKLIVETESSKELVSFKCITTGPTYNIASEHDVVKRDVLPEGFQEEAPEELEITSLTKKAPEPVLGVGVRQGDSLVTGELNVSPGTLLAMEVFLDKSVNGSADVYGIGVSHMQVTDTKSQEETIIFNGCSVDPYLFENFNTVDGDFLTAKFRAFKFPDSTYVQFRGTVNVCLDKCKGIQCSNGQVGYGRRRREIADNNDPNKIYEISMTTFIKVETDESEDQMELEEKLKQLKVINQKLARNSRGSSVFESVHDQKMVPMENDDAVVEETTRIRSPGTVTVNAAYSLSSVTAIFTVMSVLLLKLFL